MTAIDIDQLDLRDTAAIAAMVTSQPWAAVISAGAYTAVNKAEATSSRLGGQRDGTRSVRPSRRGRRVDHKTGRKYIARGLDPRGNHECARSTWTSRICAWLAGIWPDGTTPALQGYRARLRWRLQHGGDKVRALRPAGSGAGKAKMSAS